MNSAANTTTETATLTIELDGLTLTYSTDTDPRIEDIEDGKVWTKTKKAAEELAREMRAWGLLNARSHGHAAYPMGGGFGA